MRKLSLGYLFLLASLLLFASYQASAQIVWIDGGANCNQGNTLYPIGQNNYYGAAVECDVTALCSDTLLLFKSIAAQAWSGLACPLDVVENDAHSGWNQVDTVNANALALDLYNAQVRGSAFAQESCYNAPLSYNSDYPNVCGQQVNYPDPGGGADPNPQPILCYYGATFSPGENDGCGDTGDTLE